MCFRIRAASCFVLDVPTGWPMFGLRLVSHYPHKSRGELIFGDFRLPLDPFIVKEPRFRILVARVNCNLHWCHMQPYSIDHRSYSTYSASISSNRGFSRR